MGIGPGNKFKLYSKWRSRVTLIISFLCLVLLFQNCSGTWGHLTPFGQTTTYDGVGYGGVTGQNYFRYTKDWTCQGIPNFRALLNITNQSITLTQNQMLTCGVVTNNIDPSTVDISPFQQNVIGFQEGVFERQAATPAQVTENLPTNLVEAWCRDSVGSSETIETISRYDYTTRQATNQIYYLQNSQIVQAPLTPVSRLVSWRTVEFKTKDGFDLVVHRDQPSSIPGQFIGDLNANVAGLQIAKSVTCRLAYDLDPDIWPAKILADRNVTDVKVSPNGSAISYVSKGMFVEKTDGTQHVSIASSPVTNITTFDFTPDSKKIIFNSNGNLIGAHQLYISSIDGSNLTQIGDTLSSPTQGASEKFSLSLDGTKIIYADNYAIGAAGPVNLVRSAPISGGPSTVISQGLPIDSAAVGAYGFAVSPVTGRVVYAGGNLNNPRYYSAFPDGTGQVDITPTFIPMQSMTEIQDCTGWCSTTFSILPGIHFIGNSDFISLGAALASTTPSPYTPTLKQFVLNSVGTKEIDVVSYPRDYFVADYKDESPSGRYVAQTMGYTDVSNSTPVFVQSPSTVMDLNTQTKLTMPFLSSGFYTNDSKFFFGTGPTISGQKNDQIYAVNLSQMQGGFICPAAQSAAIQVVDIGNDTLAITAYDFMNQILFVYTQNLASGQDCQQVNSIPLAMTEMDMMTPSADGTVFTVLTRTNATYDTVLYIPLNGKPAYKVNTPAYIGASINGANILPDSKTVIYWGAQTESGLNNIYSWTAPP